MGGFHVSPAGTVGSVGADGVVGVGRGDDPCAHGDVVAAQALRVSRAVEVLLVVQHERHEVVKFGRLLDDPLAQHGVLADALPLLRREAPFLRKDGVRHADLPHIVEKRPVLDAGHIRGG